MPWHQPEVLSAKIKRNEENTLKLSLIKLIALRFLELFLTCVGISSIITLFYVMGVFESQGFVNTVLLLGWAAFLILNFLRLREYYYDFANNRLYFFVTIVAHLIFGGVNFLACFFHSSALFNWFFAITKFAMRSNISAGIFDSGLVFHAVGLLLIVLSPIGMFWITKEDVEVEE